MREGGGREGGGRRRLISNLSVLICWYIKYEVTREGGEG